LSCRALVDGVHDVLELANALLDCPAQDTATTTRSLSLARASADTAGCFSRTQLAMGTLLELRAIAPAPAQFDAAAEACFARVEHLESLWSTWRSSSEISRLNATAAGTWLPLEAETLALLARAAQLRSQSDSAFAVESGALIELWRQADAQQIRPADAALELARGASAADAFELDLKLGRARRMHPQARLDLGAIGKGAALDAIAVEFRARGLQRAVFDFGGQLLALDGPREGSGWPVLVRDPRPRASLPLWELELAHGSLACSADDQRSELLLGQLRSHVIDPRSGQPARQLALACALSENATDADAWSTAAFVLGGAARAVSERIGGPRLLLLQDDGSLWTASGFPGRGAAR
jgi:thiamine biosynthesis lipoprotein